MHILRRLLWQASTCWLAAAALSATNGPSGEGLALLEAFGRNMDKLTNFSLVEETSSTVNAQYSSPPYSALSGTRQKWTSTQRSLDGERFSVRRRLWGNVKSVSASVSREEGPYNSLLWDGARFLSQTTTGNKPGRAELYTHRPAKFREFRNECSGGALWGTFGDTRVDLELRKAASLSVREMPEPVGKASCRVIDAVARGTKYTLWLDPSRGHCIPRAQVQFSPSLSLVLTSVILREVDGVWVPVGGTARTNRRFANGDFEDSYDDIRITSVVLKPDHTRLRSFRPDDLRNGAKVNVNLQVRLHKDLPEWRDGRIIDQQGRVVAVFPP